MSDDVVLDSSSPISGGAIPITSLAQWEALAAMAKEVMESFQSDFEQMTLEQAQFVRHLRVDEGYSWRGVAQECADAWAGDWDSNQLAGMAICERAAQMHDEDYMREPWN